jgi:hypothetical protein
MSRRELGLITLWQDVLMISDIAYRDSLIISIEADPYETTLLMFTSIILTIALNRHVYLGKDGLDIGGIVAGYELRRFSTWEQYSLDKEKEIDNG